MRAEVDLLGGTAKHRCRRDSVDETVAILAEVARSHANVKLILYGSRADSTLRWRQLRGAYRARAMIAAAIERQSFL